MNTISAVFWRRLISDSRMVFRPQSRSTFKMLTSSPRGHMIQAHYEGSCGPFSCGSSTCTVRASFRDERTLQRHLKTKHGVELFECACDEPRPRRRRKDKHQKHLKSGACYGGNPFQCECGHSTHNLEAHEVHIKACGRKTRGRPPKRRIADISTTGWNAERS